MRRARGWRGLGSRGPGRILGQPRTLEPLATGLAADALALRIVERKQVVDELVEAGRPQPDVGVVVALLTRCPHLRTLITSREPLGVPGKVVWRVPALGVPDESTRVTLDDGALIDFRPVVVIREQLVRTAIVWWRRCGQALPEWVVLAELRQSGTGVGVELGVDAAGGGAGAMLAVRAPLADLEELVLNEPNVMKHIQDKPVKKFIVVPGKLVNVFA